MHYGREKAVNKRQGKPFVKLEKVVLLDGDSPSFGRTKSSMLKSIAIFSFEVSRQWLQNPAYGDSLKLRDIPFSLLRSTLQAAETNGLI